MLYLITHRDLQPVWSDKMIYYTHYHWIHTLDDRLYHPQFGQGKPQPREFQLSKTRSPRRFGARPRWEWSSSVAQANVIFQDCYVCCVPQTRLHRWGKQEDAVSPSPSACHGPCDGGTQVWLSVSPTHYAGAQWEPLAHSYEWHSSAHQLLSDSDRETVECFLKPGE